MAEGRVERRLAAVLAADVAGYSRLMGNDEEGTLAALQTCRRDLIDPKIAEHRGRIVKTTGDGALIEFASAVDATRCALEIQRAMAERNIGVAEERRIEFRIGINVGDIIVDGADLFGDAVNVASRIEALAQPGAICMSDSAYHQVKGKLSLNVDDTGAQQLKNITQPVRVYAVRLEGAPARVALALPDKPSIAVLPFENMSREAEQEYFADGITEDIITELSRFSDLFVIARNSSFQYKGKSADLRQVGRELGVRYVLEGSIRRAGDRVRITAQLIDTGTGAHRWAERYDRELKDVFAIQDEVARTIAAILAAHVNKAEAERALLKPPATWQAYDYYMRAAAAWAAFLSSWRSDALVETRQSLAQSLSIDPRYARANALLASTYRVAWLNPVKEGEFLSPPTLDRAIELARAAIEIDPNLPEAYAELAYTIVRKRDFDAASAAAERAIDLNANFTDYRLAFVFMCLGQCEKAIAMGKAQMRLDPFHPFFAPSMVGQASYIVKQYNEARHWLRQAVSQSPNQQYAHFWLAAAYAQLGQQDEARAEAAQVLRINPKFTIRVTPQVPFKNPQDMEHLIDGLRKAGLPE